MLSSSQYNVVQALRHKESTLARCLKNLKNSLVQLIIQVKPANQIGCQFSSANNPDQRAIKNPLQPNVLKTNPVQLTTGQTSQSNRVPLQLSQQMRPADQFVAISYSGPDEPSQLTNYSYFFWVCTLVEECRQCFDYVQFSVLTVYSLYCELLSTKSTNRSRKKKYSVTKVPIEIRCWGNNMAPKHQKIQGKLEVESKTGQHYKEHFASQMQRQLFRCYVGKLTCHHQILVYKFKTYDFEKKKAYD